MKKIIEIKNLSKRFGSLAAVNKISFTVKKGELFAFLGTNGAGKSTTISMICTLLKKDTGCIVVDELDIDTNATQIRSRLGVVFQDNVLDDLLTVKENLSIRARFQGINGAECHELMKELKETFELADIWKRPYGKLSGGQQRKCEIARAVLGNPEILILDEPTTGLDPQTRTKIWQIIREMQNKRGMTVFLTTHYMEEADAADNVVIMEKGEIRAEGTPSSLKSIYGKDTLKLRFKNISNGLEKIEDLGYPSIQKNDTLLISVSSSHEALKILNHLNDFIDFELIQGSMDDVFLAVTDYRRGHDDRNIYINK